jgi:hypothetical protein
LTVGGNLGFDLSIGLAYFARSRSKIAFGSRLNSRLAAVLGNVTPTFLAMAVNVSPEYSKL